MTKKYAILLASWHFFRLQVSNSRLDPETLDFALKALLDLRQGGRLVGIISHVGELRERIDTRLAVRKTDCGSVASVELL